MKSAYIKELGILFNYERKTGIQLIRNNVIINQVLSNQRPSTFRQILLTQEGVGDDLAYINYSLRETGVRFLSQSRPYPT